MGYWYVLFPEEFPSYPDYQYYSGTLSISLQHFVNVNGLSLNKTTGFLYNNGTSTKPYTLIKTIGWYGAIEK